MKQASQSPTTFICPGCPLNNTVRLVIVKLLLSTLFMVVKGYKSTMENIPWRNGMGQEIKSLHEF